MSNNVEEDSDNIAAQRALRIAFQTMQERCHQLENRLAAVEEENMRLKVNEACLDLVQGSDTEPPTIESLQARIEELVKQKSQLTHHVFMVAAENKQLWNRLTRLTRTNKTLGSKLIKISDTLKQKPHNKSVDDITMTYSIKDLPATLMKSTGNSGEKIENTDSSLEEISLRLINSIMLEKSELEQQYTEMVQLQNGAEVTLRNVGFAYPDDNNSDSLQQLKQHEGKLSQTKNALLSQQTKLKKIFMNLTKMKKASKQVCQAGTQFDSDDSLKENGSTQTSLPISSPQLEEKIVEASTKNTDVQICPICGCFFGKSIPFHAFHEHVMNHFAAENTAEFAILP